MEITNYNLQLTSTVAKQNTRIINKNTVTQSDNNQQNDVQENTDRFIQNNYTKEEIGIYSPNRLSNSSKESEILTSKVSVVQQNSTRSTNVCLDAIKRAAARKAGVSLSPGGNPGINGPAQANLYSQEISRINNCFYCQTGGWSNLPGDGSKACGRTAAATMVSINSGYTVTPNDTTGNSNALTGIYVNGSKKTLTSSGTYNTSTGAGTGLRQYSCGSENGVISAINNELKNGRSVMVKTTVSGEHWVTVTGTIDGDLAESFDDFVGIDPWYNGNNPGNASTGTGNGATNTNRAGVIQLSNVSGQNLHGDYSIITYKA